MKKMSIKLGHSPDPDDAFMFYGLACDKIDTGFLDIEHVHRDIQTLNDWANQGKLEVTAVSVHAYPYLQQRYALMNCGASMGATRLACYQEKAADAAGEPASVSDTQAHGPLLIAAHPMSWAEAAGKVIAIPGTMTSAFLVLQLALGRVDYLVMMFDEIPEAVRLGKVDAGLLIHEGQLNYEQQNLHCVLDLGRWWFEQTRLPLPLGCNIVRRDLPHEVQKEICRLLRASIEYGLSHRAEALDYALQFGRGISPRLADDFVDMYVNQWTLDFGPVGRRAVEEFLRRGYHAGLIPVVDHLEFS